MHFWTTGTASLFFLGVEWDWAPWYCGFKWVYCTSHWCQMSMGDWWNARGGKPPTVPLSIIKPTQTMLQLHLYLTLQCCVPDTGRRTKSVCRHWQVGAVMTATDHPALSAVKWCGCFGTASPSCLLWNESLTSHTAWARAFLRSRAPQPAKRGTQRSTQVCTLHYSHGKKSQGWWGWRC